MRDCRQRKHSCRRDARCDGLRAGEDHEQPDAYMHMRMYLLRPSEAGVVVSVIGMLKGMRHLCMSATSGGQEVGK